MGDIKPYLDYFNNLTIETFNDLVENEELDDEIELFEAFLDELHPENKGLKQMYSFKEQVLKLDVLLAQLLDAGILVQAFIDTLFIYKKKILSEIEAFHKSSKQTILPPTQKVGDYIQKLEEYKTDYIREITEKTPIVLENFKKKLIIEQNRILNNRENLNFFMNGVLEYSMLSNDLLIYTEQLLNTSTKILKRHQSKIQRPSHHLIWKPPMASPKAI